MKNHTLKLAASSLIFMLALSNLSSPLAVALDDPYTQLRNWLSNNLIINGMFVFRGLPYESLGKVIDPPISFSEPLGALEFWKAESRPTYLDYITNYLYKGKDYFLLNISFPGWKKVGPITIGREPYNLTYRIDKIKFDQYLLWGGYIPDSLKPNMYTLYQEGDVMFYHISFPVESVYEEYPEALYTYLTIPNRGAVKIPKGESLLLSLGFKQVNILSVVRSILKGERRSIPFPNDLMSLLGSLPVDDLYYSHLTVSWSTEGKVGYFIPAAPADYEHIVAPNPSGAIIHVKWTEEEMERYLSEYKHHVFWNKNKTRIFQPIGAATTKHNQTIDLLINDMKSFFLSTAVFYIIDPEVYKGNDIVSLTISDSKERFKLTFNFEVEVGPERFQAFLKHVHYDLKTFSDTVETPQVKFDGSYTTYTRLSVNKAGYADDGALLLNVGILYNHAQSLYKNSKNPLGIEVEEAQAKTRVSGLVKVGGWLPNPAPPGYAIEATSLECIMYSHEMHFKRYQKVLYTGESYFIQEKVELPPEAQIVSKEIDYNKFYSLRERRAFFKDEIVWDESRSSDVFQSSSKIDLLLYLYNKPPSVNVLMQFAEDRSTTYQSYLTGVSHEQKSEAYKISSEPLGYVNATVKGVFRTFPLYAELYLNRAFVDKDTINQVEQGETQYAIFAWMGQIIRQNNTYTPLMFSGGEVYVNTILEFPYGEAEASVYQRESKILFIIPDKYSVLSGEEVEVITASYGEGSEDVTVKLESWLELTNKTVVLQLSKMQSKADKTGYAYFKIKIPSYSKLNETLRGDVPKFLYLRLKAEDSRGADSTSWIDIYTFGKYLRITAYDLYLGYPDNPWRRNILTSIRESIYSGKLERPLPKPVAINLIDTKTNKVIESFSVGSKPLLVSLDDDENIKEDAVYRISYTIYFGSYGIKGYPTLNVNDAGVRVVIPKEEKTQGIAVYDVKLYLPYSLFTYYIDYQKKLAVEPNYKMVLADHTIVNQMLRFAQNLLNSLDRFSGESDIKNILKEIFATTLKRQEDLMYIGPRVIFPTIGTEETRGTELEVFNNPLNLSLPQFRLSPTDIDVPTNYWNKLAKLVALQGLMLRNYFYAELSTLLTSKILALAMTLETFKGYFSYTKFWNQKNIFAQIAKKYPNIAPKEVATILGSKKIAYLVTEGTILSLLNILGNDLISRTLNEMLGSKEASTAFIAFSFKLIRFYYSSLIGMGEFLGELSFELMFQVLSTLIAHTLMYLYNVMMQLIVVNELDSQYTYFPVGTPVLSVVSPLIPALNNVILLSLPNLGKYPNELADFESLTSPLSSLRSKKPASQTWSGRVEREGVLSSASFYSYTEELFYGTADVLIKAQNIAALLLSIARGLDGIHEKMMGSSISVSPQLLKALNIPLTFKAGTTTKQVGLKDVVAKLYLALILSSLFDMAVKGVWTPTLYYAFVGGQESKFEAFVFALIHTAQVLGPILSTLVTLRIASPKTTLFVNQFESPRPIPLESTLTYIPSKFMINTGSPSTLFSDYNKDVKDLNDLSSQLNKVKARLLVSLSQVSYSISDLNLIIDVVNSADLMLRRAALKALTPELQNEIAGNLTLFSALRQELLDVLNLIVSTPSLRFSYEDTYYISLTIDEMARLLHDAAQIVSRAEPGSYAEKLRAVIVFRQEDVEISIKEGVARIEATVHNLGDEPANVYIGLANGHNEIRSDKKEVKPRSQERFSFEAEVDQNLLKENLVLQVNADGHTVAATVISLEDTKGGEVYYSSGGKLEVWADAPIKVENDKIKLSGVRNFLVLVSDEVMKPRFLAELDGKVVRSGELRLDGATLVGVALSKPTTGVLTLRSVTSKSETVVGQGQVHSNLGVTVESKGKIVVQITQLQENPFKESKVIEIAEKAKFLLLDIIEADEASVAVSVKISELDVKKADEIGIFKYLAQKEEYILLRNWVYDEGKKEIVLTLSTGDPVLAVVKLKASGSIEVIKTQASEKTETTTTIETKREKSVFTESSQAISETPTSTTPQIAVSAPENLNLALLVSVILLIAVSIIVVLLKKSRITKGK